MRQPVTRLTHTGTYYHTPSGLEYVPFGSDFIPASYPGSTPVRVTVARLPLWQALTVLGLALLSGFVLGRWVL